MRLAEITSVAVNLAGNTSSWWEGVLAHGNAVNAFVLTLLAGLSTGLGGLVVFMARKPSARLLSFGLGFSAGVMVFVSLAELLPHSRDLLRLSTGDSFGDWWAYGFFFIGIFVSRLIDALIPDPDKNPHDIVRPRDLEIVTAGATLPQRDREGQDGERTRAVARVGLLTALVIAIHNVPEGMATFVAAFADPPLGFSVAVAVAIHNIPEGMSVAVLVFFASRNRGKAFAHSLASGLAEPAGAGVAYLTLHPFLDDAVVGAMLALVGGIMVFISFDELLPTAREYGKGHLEITGVVMGMMVMAVGLAVS